MKKPSIVTFKFEDKTETAFGFDLSKNSVQEVVKAIAADLARRKALVNSAFGKHIVKKANVISHRILRMGFIHNGAVVKTQLSGIRVSNKVLTDTAALTQALTAMFADFQEQSQVLELVTPTELLGVLETVTLPAKIEN